MRAGNRIADNPVNLDEFLFARFSVEWLDNGKLSPNKYPKLPDFSMNRSGHNGRWWYVLIRDPPDINDSQAEARNRHRPCEGVFRLRVEELPEDYCIGDDKYTFVAIHDPLEHNYQHCEIAVLKNGTERCDENELNSKAKAFKQLRKHYRTSMARATILCRPIEKTAKK